MKSASVFLGFAPWIVFSVIAGPSTWMWAALAALVCSLIISVPTWVRTRSTNVLEVVGLAFFAALTVAALVLDRADLMFLEENAQLLSSLVLVVVVFGGLLVGRPFTEYYARQTTPREYWGNATFRHINRVLTLVWGGVFVVNALSDLLVRFGGSSDVFTWVLPAVAVVAGIKITVWYPDHASSQEDAPAEAGTAPATAS
jgi:intracellular septation protein A